MHLNMDLECFKGSPKYPASDQYLPHGHCHMDNVTLDTANDKTATTATAVPATIAATATTATVKTNVLHNNNKNDGNLAFRCVLASL